jgi:multiple sugar transport system substrate-binding protein
MKGMVEVMKQNQAKMKTYKPWMHGAVTLACIAFAAGCSGKGSTTDSGNGEGEAGKVPVVEQKSEPAELVFYSQNGSSEAFFNEVYGDKIRKKFPQYTIKYIQRTGPGTLLADMISSKTHFDFYFNSVYGFLYEVLPVEIQYDMTDLAKKHNVDLSRLESAAMDGFRSDVGGKLFALPIHQDVMVTLYHKDLFDKFGIPYVKDGMTWDDLYAVSRRITRNEGGVGYVGYAPMVDYLVRMNPYSIPNLDKDTLKPTINTDARWKTFFEKLIVPPGETAGAARGELPKDAGQVLEKFIAGQQAMVVYIPQVVKSWADRFQKVNFDFVSAPTLTERKGVGSMPYPVYLGITQMAKNKDAAMEVLKYLISDEAQTDLAKKGLMPVVKSESVKKAYGTDTGFNNLNWGAAFYNQIAPVPYKGPMDGMVGDIYRKYAYEVMFGTTDLNTALRKTEEETIKQVEAFRAKVNPNVFK